jgi:hypothetical protein
MRGCWRISLESGQFNWQSRRSEARIDAIDHVGTGFSPNSPHVATDAVSTVGAVAKLPPWIAHPNSLL